VYRWLLQPAKLFLTRRFDAAASKWPFRAALPPHTMRAVRATPAQFLPRSRVGSSWWPALTGPVSGAGQAPSRALAPFYGMNLPAHPG